MYTGGKEILSSLRIFDQNFASYYRNGSRAHSFNATFWAKFGLKIDTWDTLYLPMAVEIKYTSLILEEYIKVDLQPNLCHDWVIFGKFIAILGVKKWHFLLNRANFVTMVSL